MPTTCGFGRCHLAALPRNGRRAIGKILRGTRLSGWRRCGVENLGSGGLDQDGEEADGPGGLALGEGDEARFCQVDPLVVQTITGRLSLALAGPVEPLRSGFGCDAHRLRPDSPFSRRRGSGHPGDSAGTRRGPAGNSSFSPHPLAGVPATARWSLWHLGSG
jgi:hypothetical protein